MQRWGALLLVAVAGCTTGITGPMDMASSADDLSAAADLATGCTLAFSGDVTMTFACRPFLCHPTDGTFDDLDLAGPIGDPSGVHAIFDVDGMFAVRSYAITDLRSADVAIMSGGKSYRGPSGTATVTISSVQPPNAGDACSGVAHGTATAALVEIDIDDGGMQSTGPGRVMLNATF